DVCPVGRARRAGRSADVVGSAATVAATAATLATTAPATVGRSRAEVAELLADLGVEGLLEGDRLAGRAVRPGIGGLAVTVAGGGALGDLDRGGEAQADLAVRVDVVDLHLHLVAELEHVLHLVDPLAATDLADVEQAVAAGEDVHEGAELGDVHHAARVGLAHLGGGRVEDQLDLPLGLLDGGLVDAADRDRADHAVVVDGDVGAGLGLDGVDDLALRPDDLADLVDRDLEADDLRGGLAHLVAGRRDGLGHDVEDLQAGFLGLLEGLGEHVGGQAVDLRVELERGHEVPGAGDLEVHVAEGVLGTEDVGEGRELAAVGDEAHGDAGDGRLD